MAKPKLFIEVGRAGHFLAWERSEYRKHFDLVEGPGPGVAVHGFGPDTLDAVASHRGPHRSILLFPGFSPTSPFYDEDLRASTSPLLASLDTVFVNPGPMHAAYAGLSNLKVVDFSIDIDGVPEPRYRDALGSLLHASADYPQKDWTRSREVMRLTGLRYEVFPPREAGGVGRNLRTTTKVKRKLNKWFERRGLSPRFNVPSSRYVDHRTLLEKYLEYDGFVHVAAPTPPFVDGLYTATLMEAGCTGALLFWHDTHGLGGYLETVFELPVDPPAAAERILDIRSSIDPVAHSRATRDELATRFAPSRAVAQRCQTILEGLEAA